MRFPILSTLTLLSLSHPIAEASLRIPLYPMGGFEVDVQEGDAPRIPQISHKTHELDDERSSPLDDPSPQTGWHFVLHEFLKQSEIGRTSALQKLNPLSQKGFILGNLTKQKDQNYYREQFSARDPITRLLLSRQAFYVYSGLDPAKGPSLVNSDYEFDGISDRAFGFCWGFSTLNRYFAYAAFFDPSLPAPREYIEGGLKKNEQWFRTYESIIDDVLAGVPRVIPGFRNFSEFSAVPEIEFYLKLKATRAWALRAISTGSLKTFFTSTEELESKEIDSLVKSLKLRLSRGELPKILFTAADSRKQFGGSLDVHSVIANGIEMNPDGTGKIDIWDINFYFPDLAKAPKSIEIRRNPRTGLRELHYGPWWEQKSTPSATERSSLLGKVRISPEDAAEMGNLIRNLKTFCADQDRAYRYCKP